MSGRQGRNVHPSEKPETDEDEDGQDEPRRPLRADYGDATAEQVAAAVLRYRRSSGEAG